MCYNKIRSILNIIMKNKVIINIVIFLVLFGVILYQRKFKNPVQEKIPLQNAPPVSSNKTYNAGLKIVDFPYTNSEGASEVITTAIWYPTDETPAQYTYHLNKAYKSRVAFNASQVASGEQYPLVLFAHGAFSSGYASAYFMEYLAQHGFIAVAPDYIDTKPPAYTEPIAFSTIKKGKADTAFAVLQAARTWVKDMNADRNFFISYLEKHRLNHTSYVIDQMLRLNQDASSLFYQKINQDKIGMMGHSEGGLTTLGKIGAESHTQFKDVRIKAALLFSSPAYPFENNLTDIQIPIMSMAGDNDPQSIGHGIPRRTIYDQTKIPKYYLIIKNANHFTFGNQEYLNLPLYVTVERNLQTNVISRYGLAFFQKYLKNDSSADKQLAVSDPNLAYYIKEEKPGDVFEQGQQPSDQKKEGALRDILMKRLQERSGNQRFFQFFNRN